MGAEAGNHALAAMAQVSADLTLGEESVGPTTSCCTGVTAADGGNGAGAALDPRPETGAIRGGDSR